MTLPSSNEQDKLSGKQGSAFPQCCPKLTRFQRLGLLFVLILAAIFVVFRCIQPSIIHKDASICCDKAKIQIITDSFDDLTTVFPDVPMKRHNSTRIRYRHTQRRLPQCIIIGARKAGTRALLQFLNLHPAIQVAKKEVHFFNSDDNYSRGLEWYRRQMPYSFPDQITIEKTPAYFADEITPERVQKMNGTIKILIILRDPTERAISDYLQLHEKKVSRNKTSPSFENMAYDSMKRSVRRSYKPVQRSIYHKYIERWLSYFSIDQFLFLSGENLVSDPVSEIERVEDFLGIEHRIKDEDFCFNETKGFYCICTATSERCLSASKGRKHPIVNPEVYKKLKEFFHPHNLKLYEMVGRNFHWKK